MLQTVASIVSKHPDLARVLRAVQRRDTVVLEGLVGSYRAAVLARLQEMVGRPLAVVLPERFDGEALLLDLRAFHRAGDGGRGVVAFPSLGIDPYGALAPHPDHIRERIQTLDRCATDNVDILIAPMLSWLEYLQPPSQFLGSTLTIEVGNELPLEELVGALGSAGYQRHSLVESLGEMAVRGGIVDVFPATREYPIRLEYFGDEIESIREFNPRDQRSLRSIEFVELPPAREHFELAAPGTGNISEGSESDKSPEGRRIWLEGGGASSRALLADYLADPLWVEIEPESFAEEETAWGSRLDEYYHRALAAGRDAKPPDDLYSNLAEGLRRTGRDRLLMRDLATEDSTSEAFRLIAQPAPSFQGRMADLAENVSKSLAKGDSIFLAMNRPVSARRLARVLEEYGIPAALFLTDKDPGDRQMNNSAKGTRGSDEGTGKEKGFSAVSENADRIERPPNNATGTCWVICADLSAGFRLSDESLWLGTDTEIFGRTRVRGRPRRFHGDAFRADFRNLMPGDSIVHVEHGIGKFVAVRTLDIDDAAREFMEIQYRAQDRLYLPLDQLHLVQRYHGVEGATPKLDKLGGTAWGNIKRQVKKELREMASELLELYAARKAIKGHAFGEDSPWQAEMEDAFEFEETPGQITAIAEIKAGMEGTKPMDHLLCGDVGYGKTEVAMRAAFKAVMDGKQVAVLAPTTVLAYQHALTFAARLQAFPVKTELLSRFRSTGEQRKTIVELADGAVDIVIGTHRILSKDIRFKDLGLVIVDEEQRFGVHHKERLKQLKRHVDVLSMTATPIPRTLQMSLVGVRDLSVIESPPRDRFAVATHVMVYDPEVIVSAIRAELSREGQVYFVHNRVESIYSMVETLRALVPEARFQVAHGQLPERELERVMHDFVCYEADVLVTTTIIENGLDIPRANTMIINRADRFGLAQLYQLRGRIGRSDRRASAYLMIPPLGNLSEGARKRLRSIQEFADLGSGFRLAAMDLEIRGAGSLLGHKQHGHMAALGFDMYARLLEETVHELEGNPLPSETRAQLNLGVGFSIPVDYVEDPLQRLMVAKRLASARNYSQLETLRDEVRDRYGALPCEAEELFSYAELRLEAEALGLLSADCIGDRFELRIGRDPAIDLPALIERVQKEPGWTIRPPDRLVVQAVSTNGVVQDPELSTVAALRDLLGGLPQLREQTAS